MTIDFLVTEESTSSKDHRESVFVSRVNNFLIPDRATRLNNRLNASFRSRIDTIPKRKKRIRCKDGTSYIKPGFIRFAYSDLRRVNSTHLTRSDPQHSAITGNQDRV